MLSVDEALRRVLECSARDRGSETVLVEECAGRVLAEEIVSDSDLPAFDRSAMDGFAVRSEDVRQGPVTLRILEEITAGGVGEHRVGAGTTARIMTGAPVPLGADAVVMVEHTEATEEEGVVRIGRPVAPRENIRFRGENVSAGEVILGAGKHLRPIDVAILATAGYASVPVRCRTTAHVLSTGDELVSPHETPGPGQIRNSNGPMLAALLREAGAVVEAASHARDDIDGLRAAIAKGLPADVLVLSGGVSMGTRDHVAPALEAAGVETVFHGVAIKPGKPILFGRRGETLVFALPGNPVGVFLGFHLFVRPALDRIAGANRSPHEYLPALAAGDFRGSAKVRVHEPCRLEMLDGELRAHPVKYSGSGDTHGAARGTGFVVLEAGVKIAKPGERVRVLCVGGTGR